MQSVAMETELASARQRGHELIYWEPGSHGMLLTVFAASGAA